MTAIRPTTNSISTDDKLKAYAKLAQAIVSKPLKSPQSLLPLGAAFLAGMPASEAVIVYSGPQNLAVNIPTNNPNGVFVNLNNAGGNDFEIQNNVVGGVAFIQVNEVGGADFAINGFVANAISGYVYPLANAAGFLVGPAGPWNFQAGDANTLADNGGYPYPQWETNGMTRFLGIRATLGGGTKYGWIRITRNSHTSWTIVDWAYDSTNDTPILTGQSQPIELMSFDYRLNANDLRLTWRTASEVNNAGFDVERSEDNKSFQSIAWVDGNGTTVDFKDYYYDDKRLREGKTYYYRLRQVNYNGEFDFSPIIAVTVVGEGAAVGEFYPNPTTGGKVTLDFTTNQTGEWTAVAYDAAGRELRREQVSVTEGINSLPFDFSGLGSGLYFIKLENGGEKVYRKLTIQ